MKQSFFESRKRVQSWIAIGSGAMIAERSTTLRQLISCPLVILVLLSTGAGRVLAADDLMIADFESDSYGRWTVTGEAFGDGPVAGAIGGQMNVNGFDGQRFVNSFHGGDASTGTLTSPKFKIQRDYIHYLIGGGGYAGETCLRLNVDGQIVREATGDNTAPGGSERLRPGYWDVHDLRDSAAVIEVIDSRTGTWGHINVDDLRQSDSRPPIRRFERTVRIDQKYLLIPVKNGAEPTNLTVRVDGEDVRDYQVELTNDINDVDWYAYFTMTEYLGRQATITVDLATEDGFGGIVAAAKVPAAAANYDEPLRPQLRFSQLVGWINDPNGMVYCDGQWHLYFQHNPVGREWGNMTWGHAVSKDLVHWRQLPNAIFPNTMASGAAFSGGAVIDYQNTAGWREGDEDVLVAFFTDTATGEAVVYSRDDGKTFHWYPGNPIVKHDGRDPKVIWYSYDSDDQPIDKEAMRLGGHWVMVVYSETQGIGRNLAFYTSTNLKDWTKRSHLPGYFECPELFDLRVEDGPEAGKRYWVTFAADAKYALGDFDGRTFTPSHQGKYQLHHGNFYASQLFTNAPHNRRIQIGWMRGIGFPGEPFNQPFSVPHELTLQPTPEGVRLFAAPVTELQALRSKTDSLGSVELTDGQPVSLPVNGELLEIEASFELGDARKVMLSIGGNYVTYDVAEQAWNGAFTEARDGRVDVHVLLDRPLMELWGNGGAVVVSGARGKRGVVHQIDVIAEGSGAKLLDLKVHELNSIWD